MPKKAKEKKSLDADASVKSGADVGAGRPSRPTRRALSRMDPEEALRARQAWVEEVTSSRGSVRLELHAIFESYCVLGLLLRRLCPGRRRLYVLAAPLPAVL